MFFSVKVCFSFFHSFQYVFIFGSKIVFVYVWNHILVPDTHKSWKSIGLFDAHLANVSQSVNQFSLLQFNEHITNLNHLCTDENWHFFFPLLCGGPIHWTWLTQWWLDDYFRKKNIYLEIWKSQTENVFGKHLNYIKYLYTKYYLKCHHWIIVLSEWRIYSTQNTHCTIYAKESNNTHRHDVNMLCSVKQLYAIICDDTFCLFWMICKY